MDGYIGIDVGSVSTNLVIVNEQEEVVLTVYRRTQGQPIKAVQEGLKELGCMSIDEGSAETVADNVNIRGAGTTGSARNLSGVICGADIVKNEITAHAIGAVHMIPDVRTILEIGGQDSKIILIQNGIVVDFAMNTVCAAGTGSFLDHQAERLDIPIEEFGSHALQSQRGAQIAGRCTVFAESDMIHKQQVGYNKKDIIFGLCEALVRNYLNNLAKGKNLKSPIVFQGGVAANAGIRRAFEEALDMEIHVPDHYDVMGAIGAALLAKEIVLDGRQTSFNGFVVAERDYKTSSFHCGGCSNTCEIIKIELEGSLLARWGGRCGKWELDEEPEKINLAAL